MDELSALIRHLDREIQALYATLQSNPGDHCPEDAAVYAEMDSLSDQRRPLIVARRTLQKWGNV